MEAQSVIKEIKRYKGRKAKKYAENKATATEINSKRRQIQV